MSTQKVNPDPGSLDRQHTQRRRSDGKKVRSFAVAAAIGLMAAACTSGARDGQRATAPVDRAPTVNRERAAAEEVARSFLEAYGAFDAQRAMSYVAEGADITGLVDEQVPGDSEGLSLMLFFLKAQGYEQTVTSCDAAPFGSDIGVVCAFNFHAIRSDEIGRGPFTGSNFTFTVREGEIVRGGLSWNIEEFSPQMWEPFADWVSETHPKDFEVMYSGSGSNFRLTEESIRLWGRHTRQYVKKVTQS